MVEDGRGRARRAPWGALAAAGAVAVLAGARRARTLGATPDEARAVLPGDALLPAADLVTTRATTVHAPADALWPWLVQLGWDRAGWYAIDAVEAAAGVARYRDGRGGVGWRSADVLVPDLQDLAVGDPVPLSDRLAFTVVELAPPGRGAGDGTDDGTDAHLVLEVAAGAAGPTRPDTWWSFAWVWAFVLRPGPTPDTTRLLVRTRVALRPRWLAPLALDVLLDPGHAVMEAAQLVNLRRRAERARLPHLDPT